MCYNREQEEASIYDERMIERYESLVELSYRSNAIEKEREELKGITIQQVELFIKSDEFIEAVDNEDRKELINDVILDSYTIPLTNAVRDRILLLTPADEFLEAEQYLLREKELTSLFDDDFGMITFLREKYNGCEPYFDKDLYDKFCSKIYVNPINIDKFGMQDSEDIVREKKPYIYKRSVNAIRAFILRTLSELFYYTYIADRQDRALSIDDIPSEFYDRLTVHNLELLQVQNEFAGLSTQTFAVGLKQIKKNNRHADNFIVESYTCNKDFLVEAVDTLITYTRERENVLIDSLFLKLNAGTTFKNE